MELPRFSGGCSEPVINWSKVPFARLENETGLDPDRAERVRADFRTFCRKASATGYNAVTLDDLAHCCSFPFYSVELKEKIEDYRRLYRCLFDTAAEFGMKVFMTTDLLFFNEAIDRSIASHDTALRRFAAHACRQLFEVFPDVAGIIFRVGEVDGVDVEGDFHSRIMIRHPSQARKMIQALLPVFEEFDTLMIFRTWSVGVGRVGGHDLESGHLR